MKNHKKTSEISPVGSTTSFESDAYAFCTLKPGYFDHILARNAIRDEEDESPTLPATTRVPLSGTIVLEIERWNGKLFRI